MTMNSAQMLDCWVTQEGNRFENLLVERGYLQEEDRGDLAKIHDAARDWRGTYIEDLGIEDAEWRQEIVTQPENEVPNWLLGGWRGWWAYRPEGARFTRFADVVAALINKQEGVLQHHLEDIPKLARHLDEALTTGKIFQLRCGNDIAVLEGTHRMTGLVYAAQSGLAVPQRLTNVYACVIPEDRRHVFTAFCEGRPVVMGTFYKEKTVE